jgi:hypothetical protein
LFAIKATSQKGYREEREMESKKLNKHKFRKDSGMTYEQVFNFAFRQFLIPIIQNLRKEYNEETFINALKKASFEAAVQNGQMMAQKLPRNDLKAFTAWARVKDRFWDHVLTFDVVEDTDRAVEIRVTECLWQKVFQKSGATDLGYATVCNPDYALCQAFNPKIRMVRSKTLMQGEACCDHRWVWEE